jgi:hypothetical protein
LASEGVSGHPPDLVARISPGAPRVRVALLERRRYLSIASRFTGGSTTSALSFDASPD